MIEWLNPLRHQHSSSSLPDKIDGMRVEDSFSSSGEEDVEDESTRRRSDAYAFRKLTDPSSNILLSWIDVQGRRSQR